MAYHGGGTKTNKETNQGQNTNRSANVVQNNTARSNVVQNNDRIIWYCIHAFTVI